MLFLASFDRGKTTVREWAIQHVHACAGFVALSLEWLALLGVCHAFVALCLAFSGFHPPPPWLAMASTIVPKSFF